MIVSEKNLEDYIVDKFSTLEGQLELCKKGFLPYPEDKWEEWYNGRDISLKQQYHTNSGIIDLLILEKEEGATTATIIELKSKNTGDEAVVQINKYIHDIYQEFYVKDEDLYIYYIVVAPKYKFSRNLDSLEETISKANLRVWGWNYLIVTADRLNIEFKDLYEDE